MLGYAFLTAWYHFSALIESGAEGDESQDDHGATRKVAILRPLYHFFTITVIIFDLFRLKILVHVSILICLRKTDKHE
ncbi:hypothetical protein KDH_73100 [Dictyobacter sp. S3.2.2.5]|uniref:NarG-like domain-containing protein n=1 Tax=Dictyobacter halimunensis TaxID=3026934 RepID=A0ABQ6G1T8_9CHLR|nr:hypothetical protein KDH_73100 [Dictyobacter sp. S3.2.2.5]